MIGRQQRAISAGCCAVTLSSLLQERHDSLAAALDSSSAGPQGQGGAGDGGVVTEAEWKAKYEAVKAQLPAYKAMKKELAELEAEVGSWHVSPAYAVESMGSLVVLLKEVGLRQGAAVACAVD